MMRERARERPERARESQRELHYEPTPHFIPLWLVQGEMTSKLETFHLCVHQY